MSVNAQYSIHGKPIATDANELGIYSYGRVNVYYRRINVNELVQYLNQVPKLEAFDYAISQLESASEQIGWSQTPRSQFSAILIEKGLPVPKDINSVRDSILNYQKFLKAVVETLRDK